MKPELENLIKLQEIDLRIHELELSKVEHPEAVTKLEGEINDASREAERITSRLEQVEQDKKDASHKITEAKESLDKSQERLNAITTNREYDAVHAEIEAHKASIQTEEDRQINASEELEQLTELKKEADEKLEKVKSENEPQINDLKEKIASIDSRIAGVEEERNNVVPNISKPTLGTYDFIRNKRKNRKALSFIDSKGTCSVCFKVLEPQLINEVKKGDRLRQCGSCGSILLWQEDIEQSESSEQ
ncbi:MAG: hypothetical protein GF401_04380 [Chitinivibrionales bacterium]|nr:hypothetical protein [Chitinivibrionales bacterium]